MVQMYKGGKTRIELTGASSHGGAMIMDMATGNMTVLMPQKKIYMVMNMQQMAESMKNLPMARHSPSAAAPAGVPAIKATGKTDTVAGYTCEYYAVGQAQEGEICAAKGLGMFGLGQSPMGGGATGALAALANPEYAKLFKDGFFPLKFVKLEKGQRQTLLEVTQVEKKALDASLFSPPPDYKEMKMPAFGQKP
jgi:hypothetical protein